MSHGINSRRGGPEKIRAVQCFITGQTVRVGNGARVRLVELNEAGKDLDHQVSAYVSENIALCGEEGQVYQAADGNFYRLA